MKRFLLGLLLVLTCTPAFALDTTCPEGHPSVTEMVNDAAAEHLPFAKAPDALATAILASVSTKFPDADGLYIRMEAPNAWSLHLTQGECHVASAGPFTLPDLMHMIQDGRRHSA
jgi:transposase